MPLPQCCASFFFPPLKDEWMWSHQNLSTKWIFKLLHASVIHNWLNYRNLKSYLSVIQLIFKPNVTNWITTNISQATEIYVQYLIY